MEISIIIPVYNTEQYLEECLDSIIAQEFKDWECLLVDDGSTDKSGCICDQYMKQDNRFKVFHIGNSGVSFARNLGIKYASAKYIAFIDSDDTIDKNYLSRLHSAMVKNEVDLIVCGMKLVRPSGTEIITAAEGLVSVESKYAKHFIDLNRKSLLYGPVVKLYSVDIIKKNKIRFPLGIHYGEDLIFNFEYLEYVTNIFVIDFPGYNYRILSTGSLSTSIYSQDFRNNYQQWLKIFSFCRRREIDSLDTRIYLSNRLWGIAYDFAMSNKLALKEIKGAFACEFIQNLNIFNQYTITIPNWLKIILLRKFCRLIWLIQRRPR